jgi:hypothetical protein
MLVVRNSDPNLNLFQVTFNLNLLVLHYSNFPERFGFVLVLGRASSQQPNSQDRSLGTNGNAIPVIPCYNELFHVCVKYVVLSKDVEIISLEV